MVKIKTITMEPIGYIKSPYKEKKEIPFQSALGEKNKGKIVLEEKYIKALKDLDTFSHIVVFFYFDKSKGYDLQTKTPWDKDEKGIFATRSPNRPNFIGMSIVKIIDIQYNIITIEGLDMLDNIPVLDIKPYIERLNPKEANEGWFEYSFEQK